MAETVAPANFKTTGFWAFAFVAGMFGTGALTRILDFNSFWSMAVMVPPMLLLIPMLRASEKAGATCGSISPAIKAYNRRSLIWSFSYFIALFIAITALHQWKPSGPLLWAIAILPSLPIVYFVWALGRYLIEESDEYMRMRQVSAALFATGCLLVAATFWGFLETFGVAPHVPGWVAVPVWAIGLGLGQLFNKVRGV
jgi:hypothetical protein